MNKGVKVKLLTRILEGEIMKLSIKFLFCVVCLGAVGGVCFADHGHVSIPFVRGLVMHDHSISLSIAEPNYISDFSSNSTVYEDLWTVAGYVSPGSGPGSGGVQIYRAYDQWYLNQLHLGDPSGGYGTIVYHFITDDYFTGGTVTIDADFRGTTSEMWVATSVIEPTGTGSPATAGYWDGLTWSAYQTQMFDQYNVRADYTVAVPAGKEFWLAVSKPSGAGSVYAQVMSIAVEADVALDPDGCVNLIFSDMDENCIVDFGDFSFLSENWMKCSDADNMFDCPGVAGPDGWEVN